MVLVLVASSIFTVFASRRLDHVCPVVDPKPFPSWYKLWTQQGREAALSTGGQWACYAWHFGAERHVVRCGA